MIFDLLYLDGHLTTELPYRRRRELLEGLELRGPAWQVPAARRRRARAAGGDGRAGSGGGARQAPGLSLPPRAAHGEWLKIKNVDRQELVIGGLAAG